jgi:hypothetical protein
LVVTMNAPAPPQAPKTTQERTHWSPALIGFYASCAFVSLGAAIGAAGYLVFHSTGALIVGCSMIAVSSITCLKSLRKARLE